MKVESVVRLEDVSVHYYTFTGVVKAVDRVTLDIPKGEFVSFVGESGSGKSTLALALLRLVPPPGRIVSGKIIFEGVDLLGLPEHKMRELRGKSISMVFQDPITSLDPVRKVGEQIADIYIEHGVATDIEEALKRAREALEMVGIPGDRVNYYPHQLSGGQRQRVLIAAAVALKPSLLIADEPTTALDVIVQAKIMDLLEDLMRELKMSVILITHDIALAAERSDMIAVMYAGRVVEYGPVDAIIEYPLHPYTQGLLESAPDLWGEKRIKDIPGNPPDLRNPPRGCPFHPRCLRRFDPCDKDEPGYARIDDRIVSCHLYTR